MMALLKFLAAVIVMAVLGATFWYVREVRDRVAVPQLEASELLDRIAEADGAEINPGDLAFERAVELVATGQYEEAEEKLRFIVNFDPGSGAADEARRILGEMHLDRVLSTEDMEGKSIHTVVSGDSFLRIAKQHDTTLDCMMHLNGLHGLDRLHPGDELVVMPLNFDLKVDVTRKRLGLWNEGKIVKTYRIQDLRLPRGVKGVARTQVKNKLGFYQGRTCSTTHENYRASSKVLTLGVRGLQIRGVPAADEEAPGNGFFVTEEDMEELVLLIRAGNDVEIRFTKR
jgi:hypothetical protein